MGDRPFARPNARQIAAERARQRLKNDRRVLLDRDLIEVLSERCASNGRNLSREVNALIRYALDCELNPPPPDSPLERRIREVLGFDESLSRQAAELIARAGGHDR